MIFSVRNRRNRIIIFLIILVILISMLKVDVTLIIYPILLWKLLKIKFKTCCNKRLSILLFITLYAFFIGIGVHHPYDVCKDIIYFLIPISGFYIGSYIARRYGLAAFLDAMEISGKIVMIVFIVKLVIMYGLEAVLDARSIRDSGEPGFEIDMLPILAYGIIVYKCVHFKKRGGESIVWVFIGVLAIYMSGSRTNMLALIIMVAIILMPLVKNRKRTLVKIFCFTTIIGIIAFNYISDHQRELIENSIEEITLQDDDFSAVNINENYRGYEAQMTLLEFSDYTLFNQLFGGGFGATVYMGSNAPVQEYIPIMHNGYVYILLKTGYVGFLLFIAWGISCIVQIYRWHANDARGRLIKLLGISSVIILFQTNLVIWGLFNILTITFSIMLGYVYTYKTIKHD